jgi:hypothetical protein
MVALLTILACCAAHSAPDAALLDYDNWYQVELLVFKHRGGEGISDEIWPLEELSYPDDMVAIGPTSDADIKPDSLSQLQQLLESQQTLPANEGPRTAPTFLFESQSRHQLNERLLAQSNQANEASIEANEERNADDIQQIDETAFAVDDAILEDLLYAKLPTAFRQLPSTEFSLRPIARSLRRSSKFDLLMHQSWLQPINKRPSPILIQTGDRFDSAFELDGTLAISRTRFLHVNADLWFTTFTDGYDLQPRPVNNIDPSVAAQYPDLIERAMANASQIPIHAHRLRHSRPMRSSELHYIDHPFFGIVVKIVPFRYETALDETALLDPVKNRPANR